MKKNRCFTALVFFAALLLAPLTAEAQQTAGRPYWFTLERGKLFFRNGEYGKALMAFEDARLERREMYTGMERDMIEVLSLPEVRRLGDVLYQIEAFIAERYLPKAERALKEVHYRVPPEKLENSALRILDELRRLRDYPEAEYWIGEVYRVEGELSLALSQYQKAYEKRELLENPSFVTDIRYKILDIYRVSRQYFNMEKYAGEIFELDTVKFDRGPYAWPVMVNILEKSGDGVNQFLMVYRYNNTLTERAHRLLGFQELDDGRHVNAAQNLLYAFLIQNSVIIEELMQINPNFTFASLDTMLPELQKSAELKVYAESVDYYKTIYYLAESLNNLKQQSVAAASLWGFLSRCTDAGEWRGRAQRRYAPNG